MKRYESYMLLMGLLVVGTIWGNQGCTLDTEGLFDPSTCDAACDAATGDAGQQLPDAEVPDNCDCGFDAGTGGTAGSGGEAGQGGATGGAAGSGGEAGQGGATGGAGGTGGSGPTCEVAGDDGTINKITAEAIRVYLHYSDDSESFLTYTPVNFTFSSKPLPAQSIVLGNNGLTFGLWHDSTPTPTVFYTIDEATLPAAECTGVDIRTIECSRIVAKSFRCQFPPYNEVVGCPANVAFTAQLASDSYADPSAGYQMVLADIYCP